MDRFGRIESRRRRERRRRRRRKEEEDVEEAEEKDIRAHNITFENSLLLFLPFFVKHTWKKRERKKLAMEKVSNGKRLS